MNETNDTKTVNHSSLEFVENIQANSPYPVAFLGGRDGPAFKLDSY